MSECVYYIRSLLHVLRSPQYAQYRHHGMGVARPKAVYGRLYIRVCVSVMVAGIVG